MDHEEKFFTHGLGCGRRKKPAVIAVLWPYTVHSEPARVTATVATQRSA